jgi:hypothetical protein
LHFVTELRVPARDSSTVTFFAPRLAPALLRALASLDDPGVPIAEINRRLGEHAELLGLRRPSYQCVRRLVHELRGLERDRSSATTEASFDFSFRTRLRIGSLPRLRR